MAASSRWRLQKLLDLQGLRIWRSQASEPNVSYVQCTSCIDTYVAVQLGSNFNVFNVTNVTSSKVGLYCCLLRLHVRQVMSCIHAAQEQARRQHETKIVCEAMFWSKNNFSQPILSMRKVSKGGKGCLDVKSRSSRHIVWAPSPSNGGEKHHKCFVITCTCTLLLSLIGMYQHALKSRVRAASDAYLQDLHAPFITSHWSQATE